MPYPVGLIVMGGDTTATYLPDAGIQEMLLDNKDAPIWKLRLVVPSLKCTFLREKKLIAICTGKTDVCSIRNITPFRNNGKAKRLVLHHIESVLV